MKELYIPEKFDNSFVENVINNSPAIEYLNLLYQAKILNDNDMWIWVRQLDTYFKTIEMDVSDKMVFNSVKRDFPVDASDEVVNELINNKFFRKENVVARIRNDRVINNIITASIKIRQTFLKALNDIVGDEE